MLPSDKWSSSILIACLIYQHVQAWLLIWIFRKISVLILLYIVSNIGILLEKEPEHPIQLFICLNLHLMLTFHGSELLLKILNALNVVLLELILVGHDVVVGTDEILLQLIVEGLPRNLNADSKNDLSIYYIFFYISQE